MNEQRIADTLRILAAGALRQQFATEDCRGCPKRGDCDLMACVGFVAWVDVDDAATVDETF